ncbi:hypothetical protein, partial [Acidithiobacillus albertensis]|uniref:hypothetical protein n=1 Tax=Acidithiobacillus albertensis TaxID=119978 RepID=UPI001C06A376
NPPWRAQLTLDGALHFATAQWNIAGQRWYINLTNSSGATVWYGPLIGSPMGYDIPLAPGLFLVSTLLYRADTGNFEVTP